MTDNGASTGIGFVLESADSVRFGPEYTEDEIERNRQVLFGELLCGLLMGEPIWTNAVFAFDSLGMVEVLGAISRAFLRVKEREQFLPFIISAYPEDKDPSINAMRPWQTPSEVFLRCYAHRLQNVSGFQLSATPELQKNADRREKLATSLRDMADVGADMSKLDLLESETTHFKNLISIDCYLRSWLGSRGALPFEQYSANLSTTGMPIRLNRQHWQTRYRTSLDPTELTIPKLRFFLDNANKNIESVETESPLFSSATETLGELLTLPKNDPCFANRSAFRAKLREQGINERSPTYRLLMELVDGHYIRTQYTELSHTAREVTSPASTSEASQIGEKWAAITMHQCLESPGSFRPWQFINRIHAAPSKGRVKLELDAIALAFADFVSHPDRRGELVTYHALLELARLAQDRDGGHSDDAKRQFVALQAHVECCVENINAHMRSNGVAFHFNINDEATCAGSLTLTFCGNRSTSQCTGPTRIQIDSEPAAVNTTISQGFDNSLPEVGK